MTDKFKNEIERLLDEPGERPAPAAPDQLRARLAATFSEALDETSRSAADDAVDPATMAAFIDGQLTGAAREKLAAALARQPGLRADLEQAADLAFSAAETPAQVPKALLARANAAFAPAPPQAAAPQARWSFAEALSALLPRQRMALAAVAALVVVLAVPVALVFSGKFGGTGGEPELSSVEDQEIAKRVAECREKAAKDAKAANKDAKSASAAKDAARSPAKDKDAKDPCDPANLKDGTARK